VQSGLVDWVVRRGGKPAAPKSVWLSCLTHQSSHQAGKPDRRSLKTVDQTPGRRHLGGSLGLFGRVGQAPRVVECGVGHHRGSRGRFRTSLERLDGSPSECAAARYRGLKILLCPQIVENVTIVTVLPSMPFRQFCCDRKNLTSRSFHAIVTLEHWTEGRVHSQSRLASKPSPSWTGWMPGNG
jgi:hypothetical protein